jgi:putative protease
MDAGVSSFKIEGRLKDVSYVRNVVGHYRALIDGELEVRPGLRRASAGRSEPDFIPDPSKSFARGATDYFFGGRAVGVASFDTPKSMGEFVGIVDKTGYDRTGNGWFVVRDGKRFATGDGICFIAVGELQGTNINRVEGGRVYPNRMAGIAAGTEIYRNYDHAFTRAVERSRTRRRTGVTARVSINASEVSVVFTDETGMSVEVSRSASGISGTGVFDEACDPSKMVAVACGELSKSGDTMFEVTGVEVAGRSADRGGKVAGSDGVRFVPVSMLADMRREGLTRLSDMRRQLVPERRPAAEDMSVPFPRERITAEENVTNRLAAQFYRDHGVREIEPGLELRPSMDGEVVMRSRYCIRHETGKCPVEGSRPEGTRFGDSRSGGSQLRGSGFGGSRSGGGLWLERGRGRWRLDFDCGACEMTVTKQESKSL